MNAQRLIGIVLIVLGVILLIVGINASGSVSDQVSEAFTGRFTDKTMWYILGGIAMSVVGVILVAVGFRKK